MTEMVNTSLNNRKKDIEGVLKKKYSHFENKRMGYTVFQRNQWFFIVDSFTLAEGRRGVILIGYTTSLEDTKHYTFEDGAWMMMDEMNLEEMIKAAMIEIEEETNG